MATNVVLKAAKEGLNACVVHPSGILGPEDFAMGETTKTLVDIINGEMPAGIDGSFNLCDVRDLADGLIGAADKGKSGECYILGNEPVSFKDFTKLVSEESGCKQMKFFLPISAARNNRFDSSKASKELGYTTRSYRETIRDEIRWLKETGKIA